MSFRESCTPSLPSLPDPGGARGVIVIVTRIGQNTENMTSVTVLDEGNGLDDLSSNPGRSCVPDKAKLSH